MRGGIKECEKENDDSLDLPQNCQVSSSDTCRGSWVGSTLCLGGTLDS